MNPKKILTSFLIISLLGILTSYLILHSNLNAGVTGEILVRLGKSLFYGMSALSFIFLILLFIPRAFPAWKKFAIWFIPLMTLLFVFYPDPGSGDYFSPYPEHIFRWVSIIYVLISLLIILSNMIRRKQAYSR